MTDQSNKCLMSKNTCKQQRGEVNPQQINKQNISGVIN